MHQIPTSSDETRFQEMENIRLERLHSATERVRCQHGQLGETERDLWQKDWQEDLRHDRQIDRVEVAFQAFEGLDLIMDLQEAETVKKAGEIAGRVTQRQVRDL